MWKNIPTLKYHTLRRFFTQKTIVMRLLRSLRFYVFFVVYVPKFTKGFSLLEQSFFVFLWRMVKKVSPEHSFLSFLVPFLRYGTFLSGFRLQQAVAISVVFFTDFCANQVFFNSLDFRKECTDFFLLNAPVYKIKLLALTFLFSVIYFLELNSILLQENNVRTKESLHNNIHTSWISKNIDESETFIPIGI